MMIVMMIKMIPIMKMMIMKMMIMMGRSVMIAHR